MSRGDFGYGSNAGSQAYHDDPAHPDYRTNPFSGSSGAPRGNDGNPAGYQGTEYDGYNELVDSISSNIFTINNNASTLERATKQVGTDKDSDQLRERIHSTEQSTNRVISTTVQSLRQLSSVCSSKQQKLQCERLTNEFRETIQRYNTFQKKVAEKVKTSMPLTSQKKRSNLIDWGEDGADDEQHLLEQEQKRAQMLAQEESIETEVALLQEREHHIRQLESDIIDINEIFRDLGTLVHEQGDTVDLIEHNVERASSDVEAGRDQLVRAADYQKKYRKKMCCVIVIALLVLGVVGLIIGLSIKH